MTRIRVWDPVEDPLIAEECLLIHVKMLMNATEWTFHAPNEFAIRELKCALRDVIQGGAWMAEMSLFPMESDVPLSPYALRDDLILHHIQPEHRTLLLLIDERPDQVAPRRLIIPSSQPFHGPTLDLRAVYDSDLTHLSRWIVDHPENPIGKVILPWDHPLFHKMLKIIAHALEQAYDEAMYPPRYPRRYDLVRTQPASSVDDSSNQRYGLMYFFDTLEDLAEHLSNIRRISLYAGRGVLGNESDTPLRLTRESMKDVDLVVAAKIWTS